MFLDSLKTFITFVYLLIVIILSIVRLICTNKEFEFEFDKTKIIPPF